MKSYDYDAIVYDGEVYCTDCLPDDVDIESDDVAPIFADSEWDYYPTCCGCGCKLDYVNLTSDGQKYETEQEGPQDDDICFQPSGPLGGLTSVSVVNGPYIGEFKEYEGAEQAARDHCEKEGLWPNWWNISDHGNATLMDYTA